MESKYLNFKLIVQGEKTNQYEVTSKASVLLGRIKWYGAWRRYVFFPNIETIFDAACLSDIAAFINSLMNERFVTNLMGEKKK